MSNDPTINQNPLLTAFQTPNGVPPFDLITEEHFIEAMPVLIERTKNNILGIVANEGEATFDNTILACENMSVDLTRVRMIFSHFGSLLSSETVQKIQQEMSPKFSALSSDITFNMALFQRIKQVFDKKDTLNLSDEQQLLLKNSYESFTKNGALLSAEKQDELRDLRSDLSGLTLQYGQNTINAMKAKALAVYEDEWVKGIPEKIVTAARARALKENPAMTEDGQIIEGVLADDAPKYMFAYTYDVFLDVYKKAQNRDMREAYWRGKQAVCNGDEFDNVSLVPQILEKRQKIAQILGHEDFAVMTLKQDRMAENPENAMAMIDAIKEASKDKARAELDDLRTLAHVIDGVEKEDFAPWDQTYYADTLKELRYKFNSEVLKDYFQSDNVLAGAFSFLEQFYDIRFEENTTYPLYRDDVKTFDIKDAKTGDLVAIIYADNYARDGKKQGAWMHYYRSGGEENGIRQVPIVTINCNFSKATDTEPSLLTISNVITLFHELGHAMHGALSTTRYKSLAGPNVKWDFVELPSQILENFVVEKDIMQSFAVHHETGEKLPDALLDALIESEQYGTGLRWFRQMNLSKLDMSLYNTPLNDIGDVRDFEKAINAEFKLFEQDYDATMLSTFGHIFSGGYAAGYYSYMWASVLDADGFSLFKEKGLFDDETRAGFKALLAAGASQEPSDLYRAFAGRDPDVTALLKREKLKLPTTPRP